jgi:tetratricopeptide (TPR) repeat protein
MSTFSRTHEAHKLLLDNATERAMELVADVPTYATSLVVRAEILLAAGDFVKADESAREAVKLCPNSPRALLLLETCRSKTTGTMPTLADLIDDEQFGFTEPPPSLAPTTMLERATEPQGKVPPDVSEPADDEAPGLVSETLARLLIQQQKFAEARKVYIQLSRLHPERYEYYRNRMDELAAERR